jgi:hypothetical protein
VLQLLWGGGLEHQWLLPDGSVLSLRLDCPAAGAGWILTYDGARPHITSLTHAAPGTKLLVQVIGAPRWTTTTWVDDDRRASAAVPTLSVRSRSVSRQS